MASNKSTGSTNVDRLLNPNVFGTPATLSQVVEGSLAPVGGPTTGQSQQLAQQMRQLESLAQAETQTAEANAQGTNQAAASSPQGPGGASIGSQAGSALESALGLGLSPLISGILGLFGGGGGGGGASVPSTFLMPPSVNVNAGINEGAPTQPFAVDYAAGGVPKAATSGGSGQGGSGQGSSGQIVVQIQAMDSQSFLDHSDDIAQAVRQAMLQSSVLNDVIREV
jgi:hypothetical protein